MKYRSIILVFLLSMALNSCSLAEDITPPPGYQSPTPATTVIAVTETPQSTIGSLPATDTPEAMPEDTHTITPSAMVSVTPGTLLGNITGNLVNGSGGSIPGGQKVTLEGFDKDQSGSYQKRIEMEASIDPNGSYGFKNVEIPQDRAFIMITSWEGVEYQSDPVIVSPPTTDYSMPITIYEKTSDFNVLSMDQVHLIFDLSSQRVIQVTELFIITNPGKQVVAVSSNGSSIPFISTPKNAINLQYQLSQGSAQLLNATDGFAMLPGADKQYAFIATYTMPYIQSLKFDQPFSLPVSSLTVFLPQGMRLRSDQLTIAGTQDIQGQSYQEYRANNIASGGSFSLTLSGKPGTSSGFVLSDQTVILIGIGLVGILLIGLGISLYLRDRARLKENMVPEGIEEDAIGRDRDNIMDAMIALDDQYKAGEILKEAYEKRRSELKVRLREVI